MTTIAGVVRDELGVGLAGIEVHVRRRLWWTTRDLGTAVTDAQGAYRLETRGLNRPNLEIELTDRVGRRLARSDHPSADATIEADWVVARAEAQGQVATGEGASPPTSGNDVEWLVDNEVAWKAVLDAVDAARESIHCLLFFLDVGHTFLAFPEATPAGPGPGRTLEGALTEAARRGVAVRLVVNDFPTHFTDTARVVDRALGDVPGVEVRRFGVTVVPIHAKVLIVDRLDPVRATALVIGSPFVQDYFGGPDHSLHDARHGDRHFPQKLLEVPIHDVSLRVRGPAVAHLDELFLLHWNHLGPVDAPQVPAAPAPGSAGATTTQVTRTLSGDVFPDRPDGETAIWESYRRAIASAREVVYLENQYFVLESFTDVLIEAVRKNGIELILVTNNKVDIPLYTTWQRGQVDRLMAGLTPHERERVGVYTLWRHEDGLTPGAPSRVCRLYVHSKVGIVDDTWASVGSANIDGVSLTTIEHLRWFETDLRGTEANLVVFGGPTDLPGTLRRQLWTEHLGLALPQRRPERGWVALWNDRADAKRASLLTDPATVHPARVLRWPLDADGGSPRGIHDGRVYLAALGITGRGFDQVETYDRYDFETGRWTEAQPIIGPARRGSAD